MTQHKARSANFGPSWPEVAGFGAAGPNKQFLSFPTRENLKNAQVSRHLPCLPFCGRNENRCSNGIMFTPGIMLTGRNSRDTI